MSALFSNFSSELFFAAAGVTATFISWTYSKEEELLVEFKADEDSTVFEESSVEEKKDIEDLVQCWKEKEFKPEKIIPQPTPLDEDSLIFLRDVFTPEECNHKFFVCLQKSKIEKKWESFFALINLVAPFDCEVKTKIKRFFF
jgi:hypothetical protein